VPLVLVATLAFYSLFQNGAKFTYHIIAGQIHMGKAGSVVVPFTVMNTGNVAASPWCVAFTLTTPANPVSNTNFTDLRVVIKPNETKVFSLTVPSQLDDGANPGNPQYAQVTCDASMDNLKNDTRDATAVLPASVTKAYSKFPKPLSAVTVDP